MAFTSCKSTSPPQEQIQELEPAKIIAGAERLDQYIPLLKGKNVGLLVNHTSLINGKHLLDTLTSLKINVVKIFAPEHGFRGNADAGEHIDNSIDEKTGVPIISIYGDHRKATPEDLEGIDVVIFDSQDVGARFFTYFSAMQLMLEACAENNVEMIILDRPNPNGHYVDGPILEMENKSYVGMNPVPIVFGLTAGEYAKMMVGEKWVNKAESLKLTVIEMTGWDHNTSYSLATKPSPNLPTDQSIALYPSICLFEGTIVSVGRGTYTPFQIIGVPETIIGDYSFTPKSIVGMSKKPEYMGQECYGYDLSNVKVKNQIDLSYLIEFYKKSKDKKKFFNKYFIKLAGTAQLQKQIEEDKSEYEIRASWQDGLTAYKVKRKKYLLYNDFE
jgi:uncharacterized protein YbbC (DUF1343 family)